MGYYTDYLLTWKNLGKTKHYRLCEHYDEKPDINFCPQCGFSFLPLDVFDEIIDYIEGSDYMKYAIGCDGGGGDSCKWYQHADDMEAISLAFPEVLFQLSGNGEESGDIWRKYYFNGKEQVAKANIVFEKPSQHLLGFPTIEETP